MTTQLIRLGPSDAARAAHLHRTAFTEAEAWDHDAMSRLLSLETTFAFGFEQGGELVCLLMLQSVADEAEILTLATHLQYTRRGYASALLRSAIAQRSQAGDFRLMLDVADDNAAAKALYLANGFQIDGRRRGYYARPSGLAADALLMSRRISGQATG